MISPDTQTPISNAGVTRTLLLCNTAAAVSATDVIAAGSLDCYRDCWAQHMAVILRHTHDEDGVAPAHDEDGAAPACVATDERRHSPPLPRGMARMGLQGIGHNRRAKWLIQRRQPIAQRWTRYRGRRAGRPGLT